MICVGCGGVVLLVVTWVCLLLLLVNSVDLYDSCLNSLWFGGLVSCCVLLGIWFLLCYLIVSLLLLLYMYVYCCLYCVALCVFVGGVCLICVAVWGFLFWCLELVCLILGLRDCMGFGFLVGWCFVNNADYFFVICLGC